MDCSVPTITAPTVNPQYYIIQSPAYSLDVPYGTFTYGPPIFVRLYGYSFNTFK